MRVRLRWLLLVVVVVGIWGAALLLTPPLLVAAVVEAVGRGQRQNCTKGPHLFFASAGVRLQTAASSLAVATAAVSVGGAAGAPR